MDVLTADARRGRPGTPPAAPPAPDGPLRRGWAPALRVLLLAAVDAAALATAGAVAYVLWAEPVRNQPAGLYLSLLPGVLIFVAGYAQAGLYPGFGLGAVETLRRYWLVTGGGFLVLAAVTFTLKVPHQYSRMTYGLTLVFAFVLVPLARAGALRLLRRFRWWPEPVVLVGSEPGTAELAGLLARLPGLGFRPVGRLVTGHDEAGPESGGAGGASAAPVLGTVADAEAVAERGVRVAVVGGGAGPGEGLDRLRRLFPRVVVLRRYQDLPVEGVQVRNFGGLLGLEYGNNLLRWHARLAKRTMDLVVGGAALLLALPVIGAAVVAVRLSSPGPALYRQEREGRRGRPIRVPKIRTMVPDAEDRLEEHFEQDPALRREWEAGYKLRRDPRVIPTLGPLLRRFSVDELPQLWSVVKGDMSLVGPRPFPAYHLEALSLRSLELRRQVRPGITGLWQVAARGVADVEAQEAWDTHYIRNWSLWLDLYILGRTVSTVLSGRGAY